MTKTISRIIFSLSSCFFNSCVLPTKNATMITRILKLFFFMKIIEASVSLYDTSLQPNKPVPLLLRSSSVFNRGKLDSEIKEKVTHALEDLEHRNYPHDRVVEAAVQLLLEEEKQHQLELQQVKQEAERQLQQVKQESQHQQQQVKQESQQQVELLQQQLKEKRLENVIEPRATDVKPTESQEVMMKEDLRLGMAKSLIEEFEIRSHVDGKEASVDYSKINSTTEYFESLRLICQQRWEWIFKEKKEDYEVKKLLQEIKSRASYPNTPDQFVSSIAAAFFDLSKELQFRLKERAFGDPLPANPTSSLLIDVHANTALSILLRQYGFHEITLERIPKKN